MPELPAWSLWTKTSGQDLETLGCFFQSTCNKNASISLMDPVAGLPANIWKNVVVPSKYFKQNAPASLMDPVAGLPAKIWKSRVLLSKY